MNHTTDKIKTEKKNLRETMLEKRNETARADRKAYSDGICNRLWNIIGEHECKVIHTYLPMGTEVNVLPLIQQALDAGLTVVVPKTLKKRQMQNLILTDLSNMEAGVFGTYHPKNAKEYIGTYDLIIVAGLVFDQRNYRVGYGGGYYDTFLKDQKTAFKVGVCFPFQLIDNVPTEDHDIQLDMVVW